MTLLRLCVLAVGASFAFGACGGQGGPNVAHISDGAALMKLYTAIEAQLGNGAGGRGGRRRACLHSRV